MCALLLDPFIQSAPTKGLLCARQSVRAQREPHQPGGEREVKIGGRFLEGVTPVLILKQQIRNRQAKKGGGDDDQSSAMRSLKIWSSFSPGLDSLSGEHCRLDKCPKFTASGVN